jgi:hypothetical protein
MNQAPTRMVDMMNQAPTRIKKEIYNIKEIHVNGIRLAKLEFLTRNKVKAKSPRNK